MEFGKAPLLVCCEAFFGCGNRWAGLDGSSERSNDGCDNVLDSSADFKAVEADHVALVEGVVGVVNQVVGVVCEVL